MENEQSFHLSGVESRVAKRKRWTAPYQLTAPAFLFVSLLLIVPLLMMLRLSLYRYDPVQMYIQALTLENYVKFFKDEFYQQVLWRTLWISAVTTLLCLIGGLAVAYYMARTRSIFVQRYLVIAIVLPLWVALPEPPAGLSFSTTRAC
jgi:putative spermidine/putrescine transport system permease protein